MFFFISSLFIILFNRDHINFIIVVFLFGREIIFSTIAPVISFFLDIVSCYFKILKLIIILILILSHPCLHSLCLIFPFHQITAYPNNCSSLIVTLGGHTNHTRQSQVHLCVWSHPEELCASYRATSLRFFVRSPNNFKCLEIWWTNKVFASQG